MIVSHKYKFIFIKTLKTAGTSLEVYLSQFCNDTDIVTPIYPHVEPHIARNHLGLWNPMPDFLDDNSPSIKRTVADWLNRRKYFNHISATQLQRRLPEDVWQTYFKFCIERNPWDKTLSHYYMQRSRRGGNLTLEDYFLKEDFCLNYSKYTDQSLNILVDRVLKYENLNEDLGEIFHHLGVPFEGTLGVRAKGESRQKHSRYSEILSASQRKKIEEAFHVEISLHNYSF